MALAIPRSGGRSPCLRCCPLPPGRQTWGSKMDAQKGPSQRAPMDWHIAGIRGLWSLPSLLGGSEGAPGEAGSPQPQSPTLAEAGRPSAPADKQAVSLRNTCPHGAHTPLLQSQRSPPLTGTSICGGNTAPQQTLPTETLASVVPVPEVGLLPNLHGLREDRMPQVSGRETGPTAPAGRRQERAEGQGTLHLLWSRGLGS